MPGEKTEEPTQKHLRDAREQGQMAKSQEIPAAAVVIAMFLFVWLGYDWITGEIKSLILLMSMNVGRPFDEALPVMTGASARVFMLTALPGAVIAGVAGGLGHLGQTGIVLAWKAAAPKLDKLNPKQWFSKVFSVRNLVEFLRSLLKIAVVSVTFYLVFSDRLPLILRMPAHGLEAVDFALREVLRVISLHMFLAFALIAAGDWLFQNWQFLKEHRMSKEDVKNEYKEMEGDPHIKGQRKQLHQELVMGEQVESARKADVLITNPTHLAIAIEYDPDKTPLPLILAKGEGYLAERMMKIAEEAGVPIMRNVPLAHDLWEQGHELEYIPSGLIEPVAEVLRWLRELRDSEGRPT
ncbi:MAG: type III secretion system export apparatus subunit SctU [Planctomycetota bacterium]|jgi:type III secretion protein U|nr:type III secretion system export apparatus subunit SctU [Planctomycetota bacterium]